MNHGYNVSQFFPDMFFVGTDGGGEAYAFKVSEADGAVFDVPFIGLPSDARMIADSFESFLWLLKNSTFAADGQILGIENVLRSEKIAYNAS